MVKRNPRRPSSASPTSRPRRIAGSAGPTTPEAAEQAPVEERDATTEPVEPDPEPEREPEQDEVTEPSLGFVDSPRTTKVLLGVIVALAVIALAGGIVLWVDDDASSDSASDTGSAPDADEETPVRITGKDAQVAVAAAAQAAYTIVATSYQDYDAQVDEAAELMTPSFAEEYRQTAEEVADAIVSSKTEVQVSVVAQGVVRADQDQVQALVFLNQLVTKDDKEPVYTPYRTLVTVINTDQGWLVSDLETK